MFNIPEAMQAYWDSQIYEKAKSDDIARIEGVFGRVLPASYVDFVTQYGFVTFRDVPGMLRNFDFTVVPFLGNRFAKENEVRQGNILFLMNPDRIVRAYDNCTNRQAFEDEEDETFPKYPRNYIPIGNDAGQGAILMEIAEKPGRIWYWYENDWAWGLEDNTWLGFVANDFGSFINSLRPYSSP